MSVYLSPIGNGFQFFDTNGKPLNAGLLNSYAAGTTSAVNTFTTSSGAVANANPIVLGTDGRSPQEIWFTGGTAYKFVLTDSLLNAIPPSFDNLYGINDPAAPGSASQYHSLNTVVGTNTITAAASQALSALAAGQLFVLATAATNTGATTLNITPSGSTALGAKSIFSGGVALVGGELVLNTPVVLEYDGTQFNLVGSGFGAQIKSIQASSYTTLNTVTGINTITALAAPAITAYASGQTFKLIPAANNTTAASISINGLAQKNIFSNGTALLGGELRTSCPTEISYDGTQFNLLSRVNPIFARIGKADTQTLTTAVQTKVQFNNTQVDTNSFWDGVTNFRYQPTVPGYYRALVEVTCVSPADQAPMILQITKTGVGNVTAQSNLSASGTGDISTYCSDIIFLNGSTDYVEIYFTQTSGGNRNIGTSITTNYVNFERISG